MTFPGSSPQESAASFVEREKQRLVMELPARGLLFVIGQ
jgi:hypothetical protein